MSIPADYQPDAKPDNVLKYSFLFLMLYFFNLTAFAQQKNSDSLIYKYFAPKVTPDDKVYHPDSAHDPHKAVIRSLIMPGLGQLYNRQWWKVPIIYAGLGLLADAIVYNNRYYHEFLALSYYRYFSRTPKSGDKYYKQAQLFANYTPQQLYDLKDSFRRDRDLSIMGFLGAWGIQVIDAYIDAKFKHSYSIDTDLSFKVAPTVINGPLYAMQSENHLIIPGIKLTFTLQ